MGRLAIVIVLGLSMTVGIVGYTLNQSNRGLTENVAGFDKYANARNIAHTGVNMMLRALDRNDTSIIGPMNRLGTPMMVVNVMSGVCSVSIKLANPAFLDTVDIWSKSKYIDTTRTMNVRLRRQPIPFPIVNEAVGLNAQNVGFSMTGGASIDGHNHDIAGNLLAPSSNDKPGVGVITPGDTSKVLTYSNKIDGTVDVVRDSTMTDPSQFVGDYINAADYTFTSGSYGSNMTWGSVNTPAVVYCTGAVNFQGNIEGWGILVVSGKISMSGTFVFHGLLIAYNDATIDLQFGTGTPTVVGGVLMGGSSGSQFTMKGSSNVSYSKDALELAKYINKLQAYRVMYWYE
jgi:hypothetical protein